MKKELQEKLRDDFPLIFRDLGGDPKETCMSWGFECGDGWYDLIYKLCQDIVAKNPGPDFKALQVKEKFAGLRFYVTSCSEEVHDLIDKAEELSYTICEHCGSTGAEPSGHGWITTLCESCREAK